MEWYSQLLQLPLLCGGFFLVISMITYLFPPQKINRFYGYRTLRSMKSEERWNFAQRFSSIKMMQLSILLIISSFLGLIINIEGNMALILGIAFALVAVFALFFTTEKQLKIKFPKD